MKLNMGGVVLMIVVIWFNIISVHKLRKECIIIKNDIKARTNLSVRGKEQLKIDTYDQLLKKSLVELSVGLQRLQMRFEKVSWLHIGMQEGI